ncbi:phosphonate metabolism transcriptional regulator PhnF [Tahibacter amnicola]|uniref:Phosphonate metabolism transcriptional regulator PhnF n=1 Tax=Tahibacter amnicola TaxID=2976241 RepID=A0ABY6BAQ4_9GAMM|nr:phosphonate metabolism transcriptional regulator PhnF [Tahibacter amnicola]UXI67148.1 phosphonate metabolism transcriptional regulator PhnF [Tahibacter amnicola]
MTSAIPFDRHSAEPLWRQIERHLKQRIDHTEWKAGARLPSALALADEYNVNRHTVRRALAALEHRGVVRTQPGHGSFVCEPGYDYRLGRHGIVTPIRHATEQEETAQVLGACLREPPHRVAEVLGLLRGERAWLVESRSTREGHLVEYTEAWLPAPRFGDLDVIYLRTASITRTLAAFGVTTWSRQFTRVSACLPATPIARLLDQSPLRPVLQLESLTVDADGLPVQYGLTRFVGDRIQVVVTGE